MKACETFPGGRAGQADSEVREVKGKLWKGHVWKPQKITFQGGNGCPTESIAADRQRRREQENHR